MVHGNIKIVTFLIEMNPTNKWMMHTLFALTGGRFSCNGGDDGFVGEVPGLLDGLNTGAEPGVRPPIRLECMLMLIADLLKTFGGGDFLPKLVDWAETRNVRTVRYWKLRFTFQLIKYFKK